MDLVEDRVDIIGGGGGVEAFVGVGILGGEGVGAAGGRGGRTRAERAGGEPEKFRAKEKGNKIQIYLDIQLYLC